MQARAYPKYRPSGVEWLGDVPAHWEVHRTDGVIETERRQISPEAFADREVFHYSIPAIQETGSGIVENGEDVVSGKQLVTEPVVLVSRLNPRKATICRAERQQQLTIASTEFVALKARKCELNFLEYVVCSEMYRQRLDSWVQSVTRSHQRVSPEHIYRFWSAWPSDSEQRAIAAFLDRETGRLDRLVAKKRELIERLQEKRAALIARTVTRGLNPRAKLKPSGIEWLGDVPEHWGTCALRYLFRNLDHRRIPIAAEDRADIEKIYPYYGASGIIDHVNSYIFDEILILVAEDGANLLSRSTPLAFLATGKYWVNNHAHILKPLGGDIRYWVALLQTFDYTPLVTGAAQPKLTGESLGDITLPKPPDAEQRAIADYLDRQTAKIDGLVAKVGEAVERLQEYRTALITAAVTGKIDVRKERL